MFELWFISIIVFYLLFISSIRFFFILVYLLFSLPGIPKSLWCQGRPNPCTTQLCCVCCLYLWFGIIGMATNPFSLGPVNVPDLACNYFFMFVLGQLPKYGFEHEADRKGRYRRKNKVKFDVFATRMQWETSRTRMRPKSPQTKFKFASAYPSNPALLVRNYWYG